MKFDGTDKSKYFSIGFSGDIHNDFGVFSEGYYLASKTLAKHILGKNRFSCYEAYPVVFLYRHAFELALKNIIYKGALLAALSSFDDLDSKLYNTHRLELLADTSQKVLNKLFPHDSSLNRVANDVLLLAQDFDAIDKNSYVYRYPINTSGESAVAEEQCVNLENLCERMNIALDHLDTIDFGMEVETYKAQEIYEIIESINP
jgi:hypothetical protein